MPRVPPLAPVLALVAGALVAATWTMRATVDDAFVTVSDGQARTVFQAVRGDLADLAAPATADDLAAIVQERQAEGLRYLAALDNKGRVVATAGTPVGGEPARGDRPISVARVGDRLRVEARSTFRRAWGGRAWWIVIELEPVEADALRGTATRTLAIGAIAALILLGVAIALVRRELRRAADDRAREHERRLASLGEMSAVLAHEIKNPLASLKGNAQLLAAGLPEGDKARAKADRVVDEARRLEQLAQDLLAFVRTGELKREPTDVGALVREAAGEGVELSVDGAPADWPLDRERVRQAIGNLVDNARQAGPPVAVSTRLDGGRLVIEIADRGPGVPAGERDKIFEPFVTTRTQGTGLGLAIVRRVVQLHGGAIEVDDRAGGGAVFRIAIPR